MRGRIPGISFAAMVVLGCAAIGAITGRGMIGLGDPAPSAFGFDFDQNVYTVAGGLLGLATGVALAAALAFWPARRLRR